MLPQNTEEPGSHTSCSDDILTVSYLPYLCAYHLSNTGPAGHTDYKGQTQAGATPLKAPTTTAIKVEITVANPPIRIEILPPYQIMEKISLPIVSVPKRNSLSGALL